MRIIEQKFPTPSATSVIKSIFKNVGILLINSICLSAYVAIFLFPAYYLSHTPLTTTSFWWLLIPIIGLLFGILQINYINTGSLISRTIVMMGICLAVFIIPLVISIII